LPQAQSNKANWFWIETSHIVSQKSTFSLYKWIISDLCYSCEKTASTPVMLDIGIIACSLTSPY
jgi:hypothetical protein